MGISIRNRDKFFLKDRNRDINRALVFRQVWGVIEPGNSEIKLFAFELELNPEKLTSMLIRIISIDCHL